MLLLAYNINSGMEYAERQAHAGASPREESRTSSTSVLSHETKQAADELAGWGAVLLPAALACPHPAQPILFVQKGVVEAPQLPQRVADPRHTPTGERDAVTDPTGPEPRRSTDPKPEPLSFLSSLSFLG